MTGGGRSRAGLWPPSSVSLKRLYYVLLFPVVLIISAVTFSGLWALDAARGAGLEGRGLANLGAADRLAAPRVVLGVDEEGGPDDSSHWWAPSPHATVKLYIGFSKNYPMLRQTLGSLQDVGWDMAQVIVVDNSGTYEPWGMARSPQDALATSRVTRGAPGASAPLYALDRDEVLGVFHVGEILPTPTPLTFAQLQNFYLATSLSRGYPVYFWSHMDVVFMQNKTLSPTRSFYENARHCITKVSESTPAWGYIFYEYDWLAAVRVATALNSGLWWDTNIPYYKTDCDYYHRLRLAGYQNVDCRAGIIFDVPRPLQNPAPDYEARRAQYQALSEEKTAAVERQAWRDDAFRTGEKVGFQEAVAMGYRYYEQKWGTDSCDLTASPGPWVSPDPPQDLNAPTFAEDLAGSHESTSPDPDSPPIRSADLFREDSWFKSLDPQRKARLEKYLAWRAASKTLHPPITSVKKPSLKDDEGEGRDKGEGKEDGTVKGLPKDTPVEALPPGSSTDTPIASPLFETGPSAALDEGELSDETEPSDHPPSDHPPSLANDPSDSPDPADEAARVDPSSASGAFSDSEAPVPAGPDPPLPIPFVKPAGALAATPDPAPPPDIPAASDAAPAAL